MKPFVMVLVLVSVATAGCSGKNDGPTGEPDSYDTRPSDEAVRDGTREATFGRLDCDPANDAPMTGLIQTRSQWLDFWPHCSANSIPTPQPPEVDFARFDVGYHFAGTANSVDVANVWLEAVWTSARSHDVVLAVAHSPCHDDSQGNAALVFQIAKFDGPVNVTIVDRQVGGC